jgi:propanol-preferring alcohol dehydrogenase
MLAMVFDGKSPVLHEAQVADPVAGAGELLIDVHACGVCRTDLHVVDRDLTEPKIPLIPGHEIVGVVVAVGDGVHDFKPCSGQVVSDRQIGSFAVSFAS